MIFEALSARHFDQLFHFELENRDWFETLISSRGDDFYTNSGVKTHIDESIVNAKAGVSYSIVLIEDNRIVARANLKNICTVKHRCEVGYRVAHSSVGKGLATACLNELIDLAQMRFSIKEIDAQVLSNNQASIAVLKKKGFIEVGNAMTFVELNGENIRCISLERACA